MTRIAFDEQIFIEAKETVAVELMSIEGRVLGVYKGNVIATGEISKGIYFLKIYNHLNELISIQKIIKQ